MVNDRDGFGTKEVRALLRAVDKRNADVTFTRTGGGHMRVKAPGLPPVIVSQGNADYHAAKRAAKELRKAGYNV